MGARSELSTAVDVLSRNHVLFVAAFAAWVVNVSGSAVQFVGPAALVPFLSAGVSGLLLLVTPFFEGGLLGMAEEGLEGRTSLGTFTSEGVSNYLRLLAGRILLVGVLVGAYLLVTVVGLIVLFGVGAAGMAAGGLGGFGPAFLLGVLVFVAVGLLVMLVPLFFLQFYGPAIVVNDRGVVAAFKESYRLVRANLAPVVGYDAVVVVISLLATLPLWVLFAREFQNFEPGATFAPFAGLSPSVVAGYLVASLLVGVPVTAFFRTYQVAFFVDRFDADAA